ncbi:hypothetical protein EJ05DRAFT_364069 [Pseudovirgaria hyperparasitica]|uniref:Uncharacterized protein n=1 Tax=Pseudovirgaria hyperparasitica TaxID=470096 RepID=A0A6A6W9C4_9PEZI|nr:uncharacterized protein EJ05DRAFT_364069 [Pseudovirgaria hyperparasitica]KAF2758789.1 hypothetical protein EJ05DRAFT_364069 [Pseudovirgaria hyperparasitica]
MSDASAESNNNNTSTDDGKHVPFSYQLEPIQAPTAASPNTPAPAEQSSNTPSSSSAATAPSPQANTNNPQPTTPQPSKPSATELSKPTLSQPPTIPPNPQPPPPPPPIHTAATLLSTLLTSSSIPHAIVGGAALSLLLSPRPRHPPHPKLHTSTPSTPPVAITLLTPPALFHGPFSADTPTLIVEHAGAQARVLHPVRAAGG